MSPPLPWLLAQLDAVSSPVFSRSAFSRFTPTEVAALENDGILVPAAHAATIRRPHRYPVDCDLRVEVGDGLWLGRGDDPDEPYEVQLDRLDVERVQPSLGAIADRLRRENDIVGLGQRADDGLVSLGERVVSGVGTVQVYLSCPNPSGDTLLGRCRRLERRRGVDRILVLTPVPVALDVSVEEALDSNRVRVAALSNGSAASWAVDWGALFPVDTEDLESAENVIHPGNAKTVLVRFNGKGEHLPLSMGWRYLHVVVSRPNEPIGVEELKALALPHPDQIDSTPEQRVHVVTTVNDAKAATSNRTAVKNAIDLALRKLPKKLKPLAEHFGTYLDTGGTVLYRCPPGVEWHS